MTIHDVSLKHNGSTIVASFQDGFPEMKHCGESGYLWCSDTKQPLNAEMAHWIIQDARHDVDYGYGLWLLYINGEFTGLRATLAVAADSTRNTVFGACAYGFEDDEMEIAHCQVDSISDSMSDNVRGLLTTMIESGDLDDLITVGKRQLKE